MDIGFLEGEKGAPGHVIDSLSYFDSDRPCVTRLRVTTVISP